MKYLIFYLLIVFQIFGIAQSSTEFEIDQKEKNKIIKTVNSWSEAHDEWDLKLLKRLYDDTLLFYCQTLSKEKCLMKITNMLNPSKVFKQSISSGISLSPLKNNQIKCDFTKKVITNKGVKEYSSYLVVENKGDEYVIVAESDYITDKNLHYDFDKNYGKGSKLKANTIPSNEPSNNSSLIGIVLIGVILIFVIVFFLNKHSKSKKPVTEKKEPSPITVNKIKQESPNITQENNNNLTPHDPNKKKGDEFEEFILKKFDSKYFSFKTWRSDKSIDGRFPESNKYPDFEFEFNLASYTGKFAIECKYRSNYNSGYIEIARPEQLQTYREFEKRNRIDVYIVVGVGALPSMPEELFLIELKHINSTKIHHKELKKYHKGINSTFFYNRDNKCLT